MAQNQPTNPAPKPLDKINLPVTGWIGLAIIILTAFTNPQVQTAIIAGVTHPTATSIMALVSLAAGGLLLWIGKPPGTS